MMGFSTAQIIIAVVVSVVGTFIISAVGFALVCRNRRRRQPINFHQVAFDIKRPDTSSSTSSGDTVRSDGPKKGGDTMPEEPCTDEKVKEELSLQTRADWPFSTSKLPVDDPEGQKQTMPALSLFPKTQEAQPSSPHVVQ